MANVQQGVIEQYYPAFQAIAKALGKPHQEIDIKTLDPRDAVRAVMPKTMRDQFDWAAYDKEFKHWLWSYDMDGGVFDVELERQFQAKIDNDQSLIALGIDPTVRDDGYVRPGTEPEPEPEPEP